MCLTGIYRNQGTWKKEAGPAVGKQGIERRQKHRLLWAFLTNQIEGGGRGGELERHPLVCVGVFMSKMGQGDPDGHFLFCREGQFPSQLQIQFPLYFKIRAINQGSINNGIDYLVASMQFLWKVREGRLTTISYISYFKKEA